MQNILIGRTDSIGDVILTLPLVGFIKHNLPNSKIYFLGKNYTKPIIECCKYVDEFISWDDYLDIAEKEQVSKLSKYKIDTIFHVFPNKQIAKIAKKTKIKYRFGTSHRIYNWLYCNRLINFTRKNSELHESVLNFQLLKKSFNINNVNVDNIINYLSFECKNKFPEIDNYIDNSKYNLILHPKSKGSAREWGLENYLELINNLDKNLFNIILTGTEGEGEQFRTILLQNKDVIDLSGKLSLDEFIYLISISNGLVACSTGPLHIAASLNINAIGIYPPIKPMHPQRWKPIGKKVKVFVKDKFCNDCKKNTECKCIKDIKPKLIENYLKQTILEN